MLSDFNTKRGAKDESKEMLSDNNSKEKEIKEETIMKNEQIGKPPLAKK